MSELNKELHVKFIENLDNKKEDFEYWLAEHLKVSGVYWAVTSLQILNSKDNSIKEDDVIKFILNCQDKDSGGFGGNVGHDPHILYTLSALQVLAIYNKLDLIDKSSVVNYIKSLQDPTTGSFSGDEWGEIDVRFTYCALSSLSLLGSLDAIDLKLAIQFIGKCQNFDGGYGSFPGAESHAGLVFCCVGSLAIVDALEYVDIDRLCWWLSERQLKCGGLNGRPEKLEDVCYSWWVLSCLNMLNRSDWIDKPKLIEFILSAQDTEGGGIADRPGNVSDVFHTLFGLAALSMLGYDGLQEIDPRFCLPRHVTLHLGL